MTTWWSLCSTGAQRRLRLVNEKKKIVFSKFKNRKCHAARNKCYERKGENYFKLIAPGNDDRRCIEHEKRKNESDFDIFFRQHMTCTLYCVRYVRWSSLATKWENIFILSSALHWPTDVWFMVSPPSCTQFDRAITWRFRFTLKRMPRIAHNMNDPCELLRKSGSSAMPINRGRRWCGWAFFLHLMRRKSYSGWVQCCGR